ncbi:DUF881 domain-containing protein [Blastococcus sp. Marseille-P5729]|uniref:DUF881 domain-containing protein n=1 Tax=Blastococcus sp. Marseille-P5729 TaxID=2086582 RepID=UPI000D10340B|nr:DUF881 domain-containing protein [Blastococcus sp. Marseille-P5729]
MSAPTWADRWGLRTLMSQTLDPAYAAAAGRPQSRRAQVLVVVVLLLAGVTLGAAYRHQQHQATDRQAARTALIEQITVRSAEVAVLADSLSELRAEVATLRADALGSTEQGQALIDQIQHQEAAAGLSPVVGPGVRITVGNPPAPAGSDPVGADETTEPPVTITDADLQRAVNALWGSGAEAIAVNGERIGPLTAIRQAGGTVLIDFQPVASPYVIEVIGDPASLPARFASTEPARRFNTYRSAYGAEYEVQTAEDLELPAAREPITAGSTTEGD